MRKFLPLLIALIFGANFAQAQRNCGSHEHMLQQMKEDPGMELRMNEIEKFTKNFIQNPQRLNGTIVTIPVVVHVVYKTNAQNISDAQIQTQLDVLTDDFRRMNSDANNAWSQGVDAEIEFCLASIDPSGNPTDGIQRRKTNKPSFSANDFMKFNNKGGLDAWPAADYLNMWVCNLGSGLLGYAQFPGGAASTDGVVIDYQYFGTIGTATAPFDLGRTGTHEVGHWLNLRHIWGDGGCSVDDFVSDTPASDNPNYGCATGHVSCGTVDMVENYMDYSDDVCMNLFTAGQSTRMDALFAQGGARESLLSSNGCGNGNSNPPTETCTDGIMNNGETGVDCGGPNCSPCTTETCTDGIMNNGETGVDCGGPNCSPCTTETCTDGIMNNSETGVDCGGPNCSPCSTGTCDTPSGTFASNIKPKKATLNWSAVTSASSYNIQIDEAGQSNWSNFSASSTSISISGLSNNQSYDWRVQAVCSGGVLSEWSSICNFEAGDNSTGDCAARLMLQTSKSVSIFPNPAQDVINIADIDFDLIQSVEIMELSGKVLLTSNANDAGNGINIHNLEQGMYLLKVNFTDNTFEVKKFITIK